MGTAGRTVPLRRTGSLLGLLALEVAAVLGLHWLGRFAGLRVRWDQPVPWLLDSPIQDVLGSLLRMVALVMAYWLLASTVAYLLASLTRLPGAVRAVGWATLPLVRRVADHAVAVTLATSMVGGTTLGVAGPALAADSRGYGPPAPKPVAAAQDGSGAQDGTTTTAAEPTPTSEPAYTPDPADQAPTTEPPPTEPEPVYTPNPADQVPRPPQEDGASTTTAASTTTTAASTTTTAASTTTTAATTSSTAASTTTRPVTSTTRAPTTTTAATRPPTTTAAPTTAAPTTREGAAAPTSASTTSTTRQPGAAGTPATTHAYVPNAAGDSPESGMETPGSSTTTTNPGGGSSSNPSKEPGGDDSKGTEPEQEQAHRVVGGDNLWKIARDHLSSERGGGSGEPTNREVAAYWVKVVEANRDRLRSGDPDLIYPGERITLPPVD